MSDIRAKVAYLQGLAEGLDVEGATSEGRLLVSVLDVLGDLAEHVTGVAEAHAELAEYVEDVDYDLGALEETVLTDEEPQVQFIPDVELEEGDEVEILCCPECGEPLMATEGDLEADGEVVCPECGSLVQIESEEPN